MTKITLSLLAPGFEAIRGGLGLHGVDVEDAFLRLVQSVELHQAFKKGGGNG